MLSRRLGIIVDLARCPARREAYRAGAGGALLAPDTMS